MSFNTTIAGIRNGSLQELLTNRLNDLTEAVSEHQKAGSLTLTLNMKPNGEDAVTITPKVTLKAPEVQCADAIMFVSEGNLVRRDPRQMDIEDELQKRRDLTQ